MKEETTKNIQEKKYWFVSRAWIQKRVDSLWYDPLMGFLSGLDYFVLIIPTDILFTLSVLIRPKKWRRIGIFFSCGAALGALALSFVLQNIIDPLLFVGFIQKHGMHWESFHDYFIRFGSYTIFFVAMTFLPQQPIVVLAFLSKMNIFSIAFFVLCGRLVKFSVLGYFLKFAPQKTTQILSVFFSYFKDKNKKF